MAAKFDGFSIRDYTSKMRSVDVFKCWPFTTTLNRELTCEELQSWLPPMTPCPRSNHNQPQNNLNQPSAEELSRTDESEEEDSEKSDYNSAPPPPGPSAADDNKEEEEEKLEMVCPVCREFHAATLTAVNAHIDGCLAQTMREERRHMRMMNFKSSKSKAPKKRSIAEIFKVDEKEEKEEQEEEDEEEKETEIDSVMKLWPFREDIDDEVSATVRKFRWLTRRLEALRSNRGEGGESMKSDEGESVKEEKSEMVCPVCRDFNAATVTAVNAHIDGCLAQAVREERWTTRRTVSKPKPKAPKKRSIAEILTVAPPIQACKSKSQSPSQTKAIEIEVEEDEDKFSDYDGGDSSVAAAAVVSIIKCKKSANKNRKKKKAMKKKKKKSKLEKHGESGVSLNNEKKTIVLSKKKKKKKKNVFNNELTGKKEGAYKRMVQTTVNSSRKLKGTIDNKMVALHDIDPSVHRKKWGLNGLSVQKIKKVKNCDSVGKQQKAVSPIHGIHKDHSKHVFGKASSGCDNIQDGTEESHYDDQVQTSDEHVKFSGKDDILGSKKRNSFDETMFNISSDVLATSLVKKQSSGSDEETAGLEANRNYDHIAINRDKDKRKKVCLTVESKQFANTLEQVNVQNFLKPCNNQEKSKHFEEKSELLTKMAVYDNNNSQLLDGGNTTTSHFSTYADISRPLSAVLEGQMSGINTQVCESGAFSSNGKFIAQLEDPTFQVDAVNNNANTKTFLEPSSSYSVSYNKASEEPESALQTYGDNDNNGHALSDRQLSHFLSADMINNSFPFTSWSKGRVTDVCSDPNFFGLPLNSHGELINFSSSGKVGMNQPDKSSTLTCSLSGLPIDKIVHQSSQENLSISERHAVQKTFPKDGLNPFPHYSAELSASELQCSEREDIHRPNLDMCSSHFVQPLNSEFLEQNSFHMQNHNGNVMVSLKEGPDRISLSSSQPTVRLMGKDVPIGRSSQEMQNFAGDVWTDEESSRRHYSEYAALENSLLGRCSKQDWVSGSPSQISSDNLLQSAKTQSNQGLQNTILMNGTGSGFSMKFIDQQSDHVSRNGSSLGVGGRNTSSYFNPITQESTSYAVFNGAHEDFPEQFIPGAQPLGLNSRPHVPPPPCNFSQPSCSSNSELNDRNKNPHVTKSAFGFPFLQPSANEQAKTSWFQRPYGSSLSWLSSSTDEMLPGTISQQFSGVGSQSFPQNPWGNNYTTPSVNHSAEVFFPSNPLTSRGPMKTTPLCPASIVQTLCVPVTPSTINSGCRNIDKVADRVKLDDMITKDNHHPCTNGRKKRPAANIDDFRKPTRISNIEVKENLSHMSRLTAENSRVELQRNTRTVELDPQVSSAGSRCCQNEAQSLNPASYPAVDSFKLNGMVTSGPVRLGPKRAKHILKSS